MFHYESLYRLTDPMLTLWEKNPHTQTELCKDPSNVVHRSSRCQVLNTKDYLFNSADQLIIRGRKIHDNFQILISTMRTRQGGRGKQDDKDILQYASYFLSGNWEKRQRKKTVV